MPMKSFFRRSPAPAPQYAPSVVGQPSCAGAPSQVDRELVVKRTFLHFALNKRCVFRGRRRSNSDHLVPTEAAGAENNCSLFTESRHSAMSIPATDDERFLCTSTQSCGSLRQDLPMLLCRPVERHDCPLKSSLEAEDDGMPDELEPSFVLTGDERFAHGPGCDGCVEDELSSSRDDASVCTDQDGDFWQHAQDIVSGSCDNDEQISSLSTVAPDSDSLGDHASVLSEDGCRELDPDHSERSPVSEPDVGAEGDRFFRSASDAEVLDAASQSVELAVDGSDETIGKPATLMVIPLAVPCVFNIVLQPPPASKGKKSKAKTKKSKADAAATAAQPKPDARTTVMLRHLPRDLSQGELLDLLDTKGFQGKYDFVYLPMHFLEQANLGYACVNLISADDVPAFWTAFDGLRKWPKLSTKVLRVGWSSPHQGLQAQVQRYRNSPVMHPSVPEEIQPLLFEDGRRVAFPPPTKTVRAPRVRGAHGEPAFWNA